MLSDLSYEIELIIMGSHWEYMVYRNKYKFCNEDIFIQRQKSAKQLQHLIKSILDKLKLNNDNTCDM